MTKIGRFAELNGIKEESELVAGMDFRLPQYRREVFLRFYEFHLKYKGHAGGVYYAIPFLIKELNLDREQAYWLAYLNGCSQNIVTSYIIFNQFPSINLDIKELHDWFYSVYDKLGWDTDRRYHKNKFIECVVGYKKLLRGLSQEEYFAQFVDPNSTPTSNFKPLWDVVYSDFPYFGRLASFSYIEFLKLAGLNVECDRLFFDDISGSKSHRNGMCKVLGRDDLDWSKDNPDVTYSKEVIRWIEAEAETLLNEAKDRIKHKDVGYFTLETTLCCYKSWHRKNRRYPNVYNDMFYDRIKQAEKNFSIASIFWKARKEALPKKLRLEDMPYDFGLDKRKQNYYRNTGKVVMMDIEWDCFKNNMNDFFNQ